MDDTERIKLVKEEVEGWAGQQGHNQCRYYPEIFRKIAEIVDAEIDCEKSLPPIHEFLGRPGCRRYAMEIFRIEPEFPDYVI